MSTIPKIKEEFYLQRSVDDEIPVFVDATQHLRQGRPYPLTAKNALKSTCGVRTDDEVVSFSLREYTTRQAEREVEHVEDTVRGIAVARRNVLRPRMPHRTLDELGETARALSAVLDDEDVIIELDGELYALALARGRSEAEVKLVGRLAGAVEEHARLEPTDTDEEFEVPVTGVRLRVFLRSPVRRRIIAYAFSGYLGHSPGETETVTRATALALNSVLGLATFRMLSDLARVVVPPLAAEAAILGFGSAETIAFSVPVLLLTDDSSVAARGTIPAEIDLERLDPVTGGLALRIGAGNWLKWNPAVVGSLRFETYQQALTETLGELVASNLGANAVRDIAYDIMLGDLDQTAVTSLRTATADLPGLVATPERAEVFAPLQEAEAAKRIA